MKINAKLGVSSDQHLLHGNLGVDRVIKALVNAFPDDSKTAELDMIAYTGDFWNHEVSKSHPEMHKIDDYIGWRLNQAKKHNYAVRVLKGTETHDRDQCRVWASMHKAIDPDIDFKYIDRVCIEHHPVMGDILYVPDNWKPDLDDVWADVCAVLEEHNLKMVDWVFMHGAMDFLIPKYLHNRIKVHSSKRYGSIARKYVICGHIHTPGQCGNVISPGSIERSSHGEEEPKGSWRINCGASSDEIIFQENKNARLAVTWDYNEEVDEETVMDSIILRAHAIPDIDYLEDASIRLITPKGSFIHRNMKHLEKVYPNVKWMTLDPKEKKTDIATVTSTLEVSADVDVATTYDLSVNGAKSLLIKRLGGEIPTTLMSKVDHLFGATDGSR